MASAVLGFFALAIVGAASGVPLFVCALRALGGAAALYVLARLVGRVVLRIVVDAVVGRVLKPDSGEDSSREPRR